MTLLSYVSERNYGIFGCMGELCPDTCDGHLGCNVSRFSVSWAPITSVIGHNSKVHFFMTTSGYHHSTTSTVLTLRLHLIPFLPYLSVFSLICFDWQVTVGGAEDFWSRACKNNIFGRFLCPIGMLQTSLLNFSQFSFFSLSHIFVHVQSSLHYLRIIFVSLPRYHI